MENEMKEYIVPVFMPSNYGFDTKEFATKVKEYLDIHVKHSIKFEVWESNKERNSILETRKRNYGMVGYVTVKMDYCIDSAMIIDYDIDDYDNIYVTVKVTSDTDFNGAGSFRPRMLIKRKPDGMPMINKICALDYVK